MDCASPAQGIIAEPGNIAPIYYQALLTCFMFYICFSRTMHVRIQLIIYHYTEFITTSDA